MKNSKSLVPTNFKSYLFLLIWILLIAFAGRFVLRDAIKYFSFEPNILGRFMAVKWSLVGHITGGILALSIGPFQFWKSFRNKYLKLHRKLGKVYLVAILISSISATVLAWTSALAVHWTWAISLQGLGVAWFYTVTMAYISIRKKNIERHKEWMIRSYVITFAFVSFRWLVDLPIITELGNFIERAPTIGWLSWVIPLFVTEIILNWNRDSAKSTK